MALNIKDPEVERLAGELAASTHDTKTGAIRNALREQVSLRSQRGERHNRAARLRRFLAEEAWPQLPDDERGKPLSKGEREEILGYGPEGV